MISETKKGGKGPVSEKALPRQKSRSKGPNENIQADWLMKIASDKGAVVKKISYLESSEKISYVILKIPKARYNEFRLAYNSVQALNPLPEISVRKWINNVRLIIGFPIHTFVSGDFDGDGFSDMATHITGGRNSGQWFLSFNDQTGSFGNPSEVIFADSLEILPRSSTILAGDFDGDQFDDIALWIPRTESNASVILYLNNIRRGFRKGRTVNIHIPSEISTSLKGIHAGDADGDGLDDLLLCWMNKDNQVLWMVAKNNSEGQFNELVPLMARHRGWDSSVKCTSFVLDINADCLVDTGIYGQSGKRGGGWYVSVSKGNGTFEPEYNLMFGNSPKAFQGSYVPFTGDFNGDRFTDLMVKYGAMNNYSPWSVMFNKMDGNFSLGKEIKFGTEEDFISPGK